jgi:hypothetical protein
MPIQFDPFVASQGLAAGLAGKLPEFQQSQNQKRQLDLQVEAQVQESQFKDAYVAQQLLANEDYDGIVKLGITRLTMLQGLNANPAETQRVLQIAIAARNGDPDARRLLKGELDSGVKVGIATGVLKAPEKEGVTSVDPGDDIINAAGEVVRKGTPKTEPEPPQSEFEKTRQTALELEQRVAANPNDISAKRQLDIVNARLETFQTSGSEAANKAQADTTRFSDGSMLIVSTDGTRTYLGPDGEEIKGAGPIAEFNRKAAELARTDAGIVAATTLAAKNAVEKSDESFAQAASIRGNAFYLNAALDAVGEGAASGPFQRLLPVLTDAGAKLAQAQKNLGLQIVQGTTFGALSRGELELALKTGLPDDLTEEGLTKFLQDKLIADEKVAILLEDAGDYLGIPGNTVRGYVKLRKEQYDADVAAVRYARANPNDPNSAAILAANPNL